MINFLFYGHPAAWGLRYFQYRQYVTFIYILKESNAKKRQNTDSASGSQDEVRVDHGTGRANKGRPARVQ